MMIEAIAAFSAVVGFGLAFFIERKLSRRTQKKSQRVLGFLAMTSFGAGLTGILNKVIASSMLDYPLRFSSVGENLIFHMLLFPAILLGIAKLIGIKKGPSSANAGSPPQSTTALHVAPTGAPSLISVSAQDENHWALALEEFESDKRRPGLWAKAFAEANGDERAAKATYLRLRSSELAQLTPESSEGTTAAPSPPATLKPEMAEGQRNVRPWVVVGIPFVVVLVLFPAIIVLIPGVHELIQRAVAPTSILTPGAPSRAFKDCAECPEMVPIPAGRFVMGAAPDEEEQEKLMEYSRNYSQPQHWVNVARFAAGRHEVTRGQYRVFAKATGRSSDEGCKNSLELDLSKDWRNPGYAQDDTHPVACVSWQDASAYVAWLSQKTGKDYRLLTEAEWEYAARAGTTTRRFWGDDRNMSCGYANGVDLTYKAQMPGVSNYEFANCNDGYFATAPVGSYRANAFGLHDTLGNVWEWTQDCWNENYHGAPTDGSAWMTGNCSRRVMRGGSWNAMPQGLRAAIRGGSSTADRSYGFGFRVARTD